MHIYTDASGGPDTQWKKLRIVGHASVIMDPQTCTCLYVLTGGKAGMQTVPSGELQAIVSFLKEYRMEAPYRPHATLYFYTDSKYVHDHWLNRTEDVANLDLWKTFWVVVTHDNYQVHITKVPAHKTLEDVVAGEVALD